MIIMLFYKNVYRFFRIRTHIQFFGLILYIFSEQYAILKIQVKVYSKGGI